MASLVYVTHSPILVRRVPLDLISFLQPPGKMLFAAVIKGQDEPSPELRKLPDFSWHEPQKLGNLEVIVTKTPLISVHEPMPSESDDSDALYFGRNDKLGILLQYMGPEAWRTHDPVAHTSVHHHKISRETYYLLDGAASIQSHNLETGERKQVLQRDLENEFYTYRRGFTMQPFTQHPVVVSNGHSVMLLVTDPPNNTRSDHHQDGLFREIFPDVIASYTQKTRGPSGAAKEAGSL